MRLSGGAELLGVENSSFRPTAGLLSILVTITNVEVVKTEVSILILGLHTFGCVILFLIAIPIGYLAWVFFGPIYVLIPTAMAGSIDNINIGG